MGQQSCHIYYTLFGRCTTQSQQTIQFMLSQNNFPGPNWHVLSFLHLIFSVQDHILSTAGDPLANERSFPNWFAGSQVQSVTYPERSYMAEEASRMTSSVTSPSLSYRRFPSSSLMFSESWLALGIHAFCTYKYALLHTFALVFPHFLSLPLVFHQSLLLFLCASLHGTLWLWTIWRLVFCECSLCS